MLVRYRVSDFGAMIWFDGVMAALAAAAFGSAVLFEVVLRNTDGGTGVIVTNLAYPLGDILLLSAVVGVFALTGWKPDRTWGLIGASLLASAVADAVFLFQTAAGTYSEGDDRRRVLAGVVAAARRCCLAAASAGRRCASRTTAARHLRRLRRDRPADPDLRPLPPRQLPRALPRRGDDDRRHDPHGPHVPRERTDPGACCAIQAVTDSLTGLGNRRRLLADLDRALAAGADSPPCLLILRPRRLQALQRHLRPSRGRRAPDAARVARSQPSSQPDGSCYRLGGDEFCVLRELPPASPRTSSSRRPPLRCSRVRARASA